MATACGMMTPNPAWVCSGDSADLVETLSVGY
jgi:hypothetical protein